MNRKTIFAGLGLLLVCLSAAAWLLSPQVSGFHPREGTLRGRQPVEVQFSRAMVPDSVRAHFSLTPEIPGSITWNNDRDRFLFVPKEPWSSGTSVVFTLQAGARSRLHLPLTRKVTWRADISPYLLAYLWPADDASDLYTLNTENGESQLLIAHPTNILDYEVDPGGLEIYFSAKSPGGDNAIYRFDRLTGARSLLINCGADICQGLTISPEGDSLLYEQIPAEQDQPPGIVLYSLEDGEFAPVGDPDHLLETPLWSPTPWYSYYDRTAGAYMLVDSSSGEVITLPNQTGGRGSWNPVGPAFVTTEIFNLSDTMAPRHLLKFSLPGETLVNLTGDNTLEDANPSVSPRGTFLAFGRKSLAPALWTPGRQIWLREEEGGSSFQLTDDGDFNHTAFSWHPSEIQLAYVRYNQAKLSDPPEIWLIDRDGSDNYRLVINGFAPRWIP
ncbi:MAG: hypothetical protein U5K99_01260 [Anaerolineales bacterium]|nr:hypothetical protein [Anaerolineales bacterium]